MLSAKRLPPVSVSVSVPVPVPVPTALLHGIHLLSPPPPRSRVPSFLPSETSKQFPTDGTLLSGQTYVDESMITGESSPVAKREGDPVCGGTANQHGSVLMRAERVGEETMLAQVTSVAEQGGGGRREAVSAVHGLRGSVWFFSWKRL